MSRAQAGKYSEIKFDKSEIIAVIIAFRNVSHIYVYICIVIWLQSQHWIRFEKSRLIAVTMGLGMYYMFIIIFIFVDMVVNSL